MTCSERLRTPSFCASDPSPLKKIVDTWVIEKPGKLLSMRHM
jgi:hypothetical protein